MEQNIKKWIFGTTNILTNLQILKLYRSHPVLRAFTTFRGMHTPFSIYIYLFERWRERQRHHPLAHIADVCSDQGGRRRKQGTQSRSPTCVTTCCFLQTILAGGWNQELGLAVKLRSSYVCDVNILTGVLPAHSNFNSHLWYCGHPKRQLNLQHHNVHPDPKMFDLRFFLAY